MSSPISHGSRTPAASQATHGTDYSPENFVFKPFSALDVKAAAGLPGNTKSFEQLQGSGKSDVSHGPFASGHKSPWNSSQNSSQHSSQNSSQNNLNSDPFSATDAEAKCTTDAELSTCFVYTAGDQQITDYHNGGRFSFALNLPSFVSIHTRSKGREVFLFFNDRRDAQKVLQSFHRLEQDQLYNGYSSVVATSITGSDFCVSTRDLHRPTDLADLGRSFATGNDGQLLFIVKPTQNLPINERVQSYAEEQLQELVSGMGDVKRVSTISVNILDNTISFIVEVFVPATADKVVQLLSEAHETEIIKDMRVCCRLYGEEVAESKLHKSPSKLTQEVQLRNTIARLCLDPRDDLIRDSTPTATRPSFGVIGDRRPGPSMSRQSSFGSLNDARDSHGLFNDYKNATMARRENKNFIELGRVKQGHDVRTTVMLRNIPNRITHKMLKDVLDEFVWGKYDFVYLRIDFTNNCNVGYAFINFASPDDVATFVEAVAGKKWKYSDKVAEVSYATMQGRETLIHKFRNSSVMNEAAESRPKLYKTLPDRHAGEEELFPGPDNLFKLARSNQNAAHIGLFSPNRGGPAHLGDRHRHGRFDRGTSFALLEKMMAENAMLRGMQGLSMHQNIPFY